MLFVELKSSTKETIKHKKLILYFQDYLQKNNKRRNQNNISVDEKDFLAFIDENGIFSIIQQTLKIKLAQYIQTNIECPVDENPNELKVNIKLK